MTDPTTDDTSIDTDSIDSGSADTNSTDNAADDAEPLPDAVVDDAERLTRLARQAADESERKAYRADRDETLAAHDYTARVRDEDDTLVLYPDEWLDGDTVELDRIDDTDRAVEIPLWAAATTRGPLLRPTTPRLSRLSARLTGRFTRPTPGRLRISWATITVDESRLRRLTISSEFREEYYPRNVWADADQQAAVDASLEYLFAVADTECPERSAKT